MNVIPIPASSVSSSGEPFTIAEALTIVEHPDATEAISWLQAKLILLANIETTVVTFSDAPALRFEIADVTGAEPVLGVRADDADAGGETYRLVVSADGITITAPAAEGLFRAATTLLHLLVANPTNVPACEITDAPRFAWRGLSLDVVRTFHPVETVCQVIDLLALYKLNVLHLHLTDAEGWRFPVPGWDALVDVAGKTARDGRPGGSYTAEDYADLVRYAADRFVTVVPEFDSPGHTAAAIAAFPELATDDIRAMDPARQYLHPDNPEVWSLVEAVYAEFARVHPGGRIHVGGDEAIAMSDDDFHAYMNRALPIASGTGKGIVAWQEAVRAGLQPGDLMQLWISPHLVERVKEYVRNPESAPEVAVIPADIRDEFVRLFLQAGEDLGKGLEQGADIIISQADKLYLDTKYTEPSADPAQHADHERVGLPSHVYGNGTVEDSYDWQPETLQAELPVDRIAGVEAAIWCETIASREDLFFQLLPRLAGVGEKAWSSPQGWDEYRPRLQAQATIWESMGLPFFRSSVVWDQ